MLEFWIAIVVAVAGWWFFTGLILWCVHLPRRFHDILFRVASLIFIAALALTPWITAKTTVSGTVMSFTLAIVLWGWLELGYLIDKVGGLHKRACPPEASLLQRFRAGLGTCIYHELGVVITGALLVILADGGVNSVAFWTYSTLWLMRWSAKINLILGVRNYNRDWLPTALQYVDSYIQRRKMNVVFPLSMALSLWVLVQIVNRAHASLSVNEQIGYTLVATLVTLGALEHVFLMLPLGEGRLWGWASPPKSASGFSEFALTGQPSVGPMHADSFQGDIQANNT